MKKIILNTPEENLRIFFDFQKDFPTLSCDWIEETCGIPVKSDDVDEEYNTKIIKIIAGSYVEPAEICDYEYVLEWQNIWGEN